jgi:hypothetical protein
VLPFEKPRVLAEDDLDDYGRGDRFPKVFFHHGKVTVPKRCMAMVDLVVTGDLVAEHALASDCQSPGGCWVVGGKLVSRGLALTNRLIVGGDVKIKGSLVAFLANLAHDAPPRPIAIGGSLTADAMGIEHHTLRVGGATKVKRTVDLRTDLKIPRGDLRTRILHEGKWFVEKPASEETPARSPRRRR